MKESSIIRLKSRVLRGRGVYSLADQVLVSGSNFAASVVLVRGLGLTEFGKFSVAFVILLYANALEMSLINSPMLTLAPAMEEGEKRRFVEGMMALQVSTSALLFVVFGLGAGIIHFLTGYLSVASAVALAGAAGTFQFQDWVRRYYFLANKSKLAIASDFISYFIQFVIFVLLWKTGRLTLFSTFVTMFATSLAGGLMAPFTDGLRPAFDRLGEVWNRSRHLARDLFVANQMRWAGLQGVFLVGTYIVGAAAAGGLRATQNFAGPVNVALSSLENFVPIRITEELKHHGVLRAHRYMRIAIIGGTLFFSALFLPIVVFGRPILRFTYGAALVEFYWPMVLQLACLVIQISANMWYQLFRGMQDSRAILRGNAAFALVSLLTIYSFGKLWGVTGIVLSSLAGQSSIVVYYVFHWTRHRQQIIARYPSPTPTAEVFDVQGSLSEVVSVDGA
ncbi:hypothetical protein Acid345_3798 [Candidatus Koribacter versatilis Ellin345]|uniref:Polysaccharide biosynthesis protein n=1 Tax=Koribacter versatilis (strain Ellin345) TaxID=204669 RepID=Q1IK02_KORVE|nr:hypothetical protein [Candidatus Koribacter versatilis]ABF42798.1 hypothetical protein Acid345_3798 [Candidatus Koribacter versatilis Ellin345]